MKKTNQNEAQWYLYTDGTRVQVVKDTTEVDVLKGVVIEITANEAANILALALANK